MKLNENTKNNATSKKSEANSASALNTEEASNSLTETDATNSSNNNPKPESKACPSLIYLEDIHIFALANLLSRPIIVISLETLRNIQPIHLRGIYLPLLIDPGVCIKDPIVIAFHNFHFMPLLYAVDDSQENSGSQDPIKNNEKFFNEIENKNLKGGTLTIKRGNLD